MRIGSLLFLLAVVAAPAQPRFEVVSVKPNNSLDRAVRINFPSPGRFVAQNVWLRFLIQNAWNVRDYQVVAGPGWAASDRFDIEAKGDAKASREEMRLMLQHLLEDKFQLTIHHESRNLPLYRLVAAPDGSKLHEPEKGRCLEQGAQPAPGKPECGSSEWSPRSLSGTAITMQQFTAMLQNILQRPVIDQTGFGGPFDVTLNWVPDQTTPGLLAPGVEPPPLPATNDSGPTIFNAIAESLGLRLQASKGPVDILVIDRAEKPPAN